MAKASFDAKQGQEFSGKKKVVSWPRLWAFSGGAFASSGWPRKNIHTDLEFARSCGLPYVAASATQFQAYAVELMVDLFGLEWLSYGSMDVKFVNIVDAGDILLTKAVVSSKETQGKTVKFTMALSTDNQNGNKVQVGSAIGYAGDIDPARLRPEMPKVAGEMGSDARAGLQPLEFVVTPELNQQCLFALEDYSPRYYETTPAGPPVVHPGLLLNMSNGTRSPSYNTPAGRAGFHARDEAFFINPARLGKKLRVTWASRGGYEKRGRPYSVSETTVTDEDGVEILKRLNHSTVAAMQYQKEYTK